MVLAATVWTTPWDNLMLHLGVWSYPEGAVLGHIFLVPIEEHLFFVLQPILTGLLVIVWLSGESAPTQRNRFVRLTGAVAILLATFWGLFHLEGQTYYLAVTVGWFGPVLALQWFVGGDLLWARATRLVPVFAVATVYLGLVDGLAMRAHIWSISEAHTVGWSIGNVPVEEIAFFAITNLLVIFGLVLWVDLREGRLWSGL